MVNFDTFGRFGTQFTTLAKKGHTTAESNYAFWKLRSDLTQNDDYRSACEAVNTAEGIWWDHCLALEKMFGVAIHEFHQLWGSLRLAFAPQFRPLGQIQQEPTKMAQRLGLIACALSGTGYIPGDQVKDQEIPRLRAQLNPVCYGPFTEAQLQHVVRYHASVIDYACGSGYLVAVLRNRNFDAVGIESGRYRLSGPTQGTVAIYEAYDWSLKLHEAGHLIRGDIPSICAFSRRTLLLSWPEGGSSYPADVLKLYRELGGKRLLLKLGGFVGHHSTTDPNYEKPQNPKQNLVAFFEEIAQWWGPPAVSPAFDPLLYHNNLFEFEVLNSARRLWWEESAPKSQPLTAKARADLRRAKRKGKGNR